MTSSTFLIESETMLAHDIARVQTQKTIQSSVYQRADPDQSGEVDQTAQEVRSNGSEKEARLINEQFMDGMTEMPEDEEINETMSMLAAQVLEKTKISRQEVEKSENQMEKEKILSQSLLETFEMGQDDQFENLLDDVKMDDMDKQNK